MILVVDSGSTKADWIAGKDGQVTGKFHTKGFNPFFHDKNFIIPELESHPGLKEIRSNVTNIYFLEQAALVKIEIKLLK